MSTPEFSTITYETRDRKAYITLNRPERKNAINDDLPGELAEAVRLSLGAIGRTEAA